MSEVRAMLRFDAFSLLGTPPITALAAGGLTGPMIAVIDNKLVKVDTFVNPEVVIIGLTNGKAKPGELVILEAKLSNEAPTYVKAAKIKWTVAEKGGEKVCWTDGKKVIFGAGVEKTTISATAKITLSYAVGTEVVPLSCQATQIVQVGDIPVPPPDPGPNPNPDNGTLTGLALQAKTWAVALVDTDSRNRSARALAVAFKTTSASIGSVGLTDLRSVLKASKAKNNEALIASGIDPRKWDSWGANLQDSLYAKYVNGEMKKVGDIKTIWWQISHGLYNCADVIPRSTPWAN